MISIYDGSVLTYTELMDNVEKASSLSLVPARPEPIFFKPAFAFAIERDIKKTKKTSIRSDRILDEYIISILDDSV